MDVNDKTDDHLRMVVDLVVPARRGKAVRMLKGDIITVFNPQGSQVVDTWAFNAADIGERMSMEHTRATLLKICPSLGDSLYSNQRRPILTIVEDETPAVHDTLMPSCDRYRYEQLGCTDYHDNCADNLISTMRELGYELSNVPGPFNLFMNVPIGSEGQLAFEAPLSNAGALIKLRADQDLLVIFSACPQDILPVNGKARTPVEVPIRVESSYDNG